MGLTKSFRATAANAFSPLLIVLSRFVVQEVISMTVVLVTEHTLLPSSHTLPVKIK